MTLDEIFMLLIDKKKLRYRGTVRSSPMQSMASMSMADKDGLIKGRDEKGNPIKGRIVGKSLASQIREKAEAERRRQKKRK